jgi:hypothetical protein
VKGLNINSVTPFVSFYSSVAKTTLIYFPGSNREANLAFRKQRVK